MNKTPAGQDPRARRCTQSVIKTCHLPFKNGNGSLNARAE